MCLPQKVHCFSLWSTFVVYFEPAVTLCKVRDQRSFVYTSTQRSGCLTVPAPSVENINFSPWLPAMVWMLTVAYRFVCLNLQPPAGGAVLGGCENFWDVVNVGWMRQATEDVLLRWWLSPASSPVFCFVISQDVKSWCPIPPLLLINSSQLL